MMKAVVSIVLTFMSVFLTLQGYFTSPAKDPAGGYRVHYADGSANYMDVYLPENVGEETDVVMVVHGGSWMGGDQTMFTEYAKQAAEYGFTGVTVDYSKLSQKATGLDMNAELFAAVQKTKEFLAQRGIAADKMVIAGHSSGAHLALLYAYSHAADSPIPIGFVTACSSPADLTLTVDGTTVIERAKYYLLTALTDENITEQTLAAGTYAQAVAAVNPYDLANEQSPPTLLVHGDEDDYVPYENSVRLLEKLQSLGVPSMLITYPGQKHFIRSAPEEMHRQRLNAMLAWAEIYL